MVNGVLSRLWTDRCDIYVRQGELDGDTGRMTFQQVCIARDQPCRLSFRLSFETVGGVKEVSGMAVSPGQAAKLFISPHLEIPPGSKIVVRGRGRELAFSRSGAPAVFDGHQEIRLEQFGGWA